MSESFRTLYKKCYDASIPQYLRKSYRLYPDYPVPLDQKRQANYQEWLAMGYEQLQADGLGVTLYEDAEYAIVSQVKNATDTDYDVMLICVPKDRENIQHLPCFMPPQVVSAMYECVNDAAKAITEVAAKNHDVLKRIYVYHHVGPFELHEYPFNISFPHLHMHVMGVTERDIAESQPSTTRAELKQSDNLRSYTDPTIFIARDIAQRHYQKPFEIDLKTSSIILDRRPIDNQITAEEITFLPDFYYQWHKYWGMLALCFSQLELDTTFQRLDVQVPIDKRNEYLELFTTMFPWFSDESKIVLQFLADHVKQFDPADFESALYSGIAGSVGWVHNFDTDTTEFRFGPRLLTSSKKVGASDGFYVGIKDKSQWYPDAEGRLKIQRQLFKQMKIIVESSLYTEVADLAEVLEGTSTKPHYQGIYFSDTQVLKTKNRFPPQASLRQYQELQAAGISVGAKPKFMRDHSGKWLEADELIEGVNGAEYSQNVDGVTGLTFFEDVLLETLIKVLEAQPEKLLWSIDAVPHNFVFDGQENVWKYIDYEPSHTSPAHKHFLIPSELLNYSLVKFSREQPSQLGAAWQIIKSKFAENNEILDQLTMHPYLSVLEGTKNVNQALLETSSKDDTLGLLLVLVSQLDQTWLEKICLLLREKKNLTIDLTVSSKEIQAQLMEVLGYQIGKNNYHELLSILAESVS